MPSYAEFNQQTDTAETTTIKLFKDGSARVTFPSGLGLKPKNLMKVQVLAFLEQLIESLKKEVR